MYEKVIGGLDNNNQSVFIVPTPNSLVCRLTSMKFLLNYSSVCRLVTECENGSAMAVLKGFPYILMPDSNESFIKGMAIMAKLTEKFLGVEVVTTKHHVVAFMMMIFLYSVIIALLF